MLTVLVATYNGAKTLPDVLSAYCRLKHPPGGWKLVIVDNGSTDRTKEIVTDFLHRLPLTYLFETRRGKNAALNTGLSKISGDLVVFSDDDVLPSPDWLRHYRSAADSQPSFSIFCGPILPKWDSPPDDWILAWVPMGPTFSILYPHEEGPVHPRLAFGPSFALRADIFEKGYRFDETIGPKGPSYPMGSETELIRRLNKAAYKAWHCREAVVEHIIQSHQMNKDWMLARAIRYGRGQHRLGVKDGATARRSLFGIPVVLLREIAVQSLRFAFAQLARDAKRSFKAHWQMNCLLGKALEARLIHKEQATSRVPAEGMA